MGAAGRGAAGRGAAEAGEDVSLAGLWLACYERLAGAAAHEVNNALNGVAMNLEVVRLRARPGADAGVLASFAVAGAEEHEATVALVGALLALSRAPREASGTDVAAVLGHATTLLAPVLRHRGITVHATTPERPVRTAAPARAVRLAVCAAIAGGVAGSVAGSVAGEHRQASHRDAPHRDEAHAHGDPTGVLRCTLDGIDGPTLVVAPGPEGWTDDLQAALAGVGVHATWGPDALRIAFPRE